MQPAQHITAAEAQVLEAHLPQGLTEQMREVALCLFEALAVADGRMLVDGREIYTARDLRVGLFTSTESF